MKKHEAGIIDERGVFTLDGQTYFFTIIENPYLKTFKAKVKINSVVFISYPTTKYLRKTIREVPVLSSGSNVLPTGMMDKILTDTALNEKEKIKLVDYEEMANKFSSKEEAIEFVKEYIDQLRKEYLESEGISHEITKEELI